jgi:flagellar hook-associated protein 2
MSLSGISFSGLSSGIDSDSIVSRLAALEAVPIRRLQQQQAQLAGRMGILQGFKGRLTALATASGALNSAAAFSPISASSSNTATATLSASSTTTPGRYDLSVSKLAQAHKVATTGQTDTASALNLSGTFVVNGRGVTVEGSDSLRSIAQKINSAGAGVTASVIDGGPGNAYLTISSSATGAKNAVQLADAQGSVLSSLGVLSGATGVREPITNGVASYAFAQASMSVGSLLGAQGFGPETITINGEDITVDLSTDSLADIATKINSSSAGVVANVRAETVGSATKYKLEITGASTPTFAGTGTALTTLGIFQDSFGNQLINAQDAEFTLDGLQMRSDTNTVTSVIPGATLTLLKANAVTPETSTITLSRDDGAIKESIRNFVSAYNNAVDFIRQNSKFDKDTFDSGPLFGDPVAREVEATVSDMILRTIPGLPATLNNLTQVGFGFENEGKLKIDEAQLDKALAQDAEGVGALFRAVGQSSSSRLVYVSATDKTKPSGVGAYDVVITRAASKGTLTAGVAQTLANPGNEMLTFGGDLFGSSTYQLVLPIGSTLQNAVALINSDPKLRDLLSASIENGALTITSKRFGSVGNFTVTSNLEAANDNSGIGTTGSTYEAGVDVEGTINGESATGAGQFLTGDSSSSNIAGLQVQYTDNVLGLVGRIQFTKGIGSLVNDLVSSYNDSVNGLLTLNDKSLQEQVDQIQTRITEMQERSKRREQELRMRFTRMEEAISRLQSQAVRLPAMNQQQR